MRPVGWSGLLAVLTISSLIVMAPSGFAARSSVGANVTHVAPFKGTSARLNWDFASGCSSSARNPVGAHFSLKTGLGGVREASSARGCGTALGGSGIFTDQGITEGGAYLALPLVAHHGSTHSIAITWKLVGSATESISPGTCSPNSSASAALCETFADWQIDGQSYLSDFTGGFAYTGSSFLALGYSDNYTSCVSGFCLPSQSSSSSAWPGTVVMYVNGTLNSGDFCILYVDIDTSTESYVNAQNATTSGASAHASIDLTTSTLGYQWKLVSVSDP
ncbi:MAG: hypothetical protein ACHQ2Y_05500 [Candidatus Lutacidiplasmatales archaeon]